MSTWVSDSRSMQFINLDNVVSLEVRPTAGGARVMANMVAGTWIEVVHRDSVADAKEYVLDLLHDVGS